MIEVTRAGLLLYTFPQLGEAGASNYVTTRSGGLSRGPYESLNLAYHAGDETDTVARNRKLLYEALGIPVSAVTVCEQVHGGDIAVVEAAGAGRGGLNQDTVIAGADGMVSRERGIALMVLVADCVPVFAVDSRKGAVGLAHAGWRGAVSRVTRNLVRAMEKSLGSDPADIVAAIGPSIGPCCYEVGEDVAADFRFAYGEPERVLAPGDEERKYMLDLWTAAELDLRESGVREVIRSDVCTACQAGRFYSSREEGGTTGRFAAIIARTA
jgi:YfiH family protein